MMTVKEVDLGRPAFKRDPYPFYARLRAESPVCRLELANGRSAWLATRYDDVVTLLKDDASSTTDRPCGRPSRRRGSPGCRRHSDGCSGI